MRNIHIEKELYYKNEIYFQDGSGFLYTARNLEAYVRPTSEKAKYMLVTSNKKIIEEIVKDCTEREQIFQVKK